MLFYIVFTYVLGTIVSARRFYDKSQVTVADMVLFALSPIMVPSVIVMMITAMITDLDKVLFQKTNN